MLAEDDDLIRCEYTKLEGGYAFRCLRDAGHPEEVGHVTAMDVVRMQRSGNE